jgi:hypothetical protein
MRPNGHEYEKTQLDRQKDGSCVKSRLSNIRKSNGGEGGIRTHVGLHPNGFQDRPVMTASVPLQVWQTVKT